ncbi:MAG: hypothetical protein ABI352_08820 [Candidatus Dormibacter sp.]
MPRDIDKATRGASPILLVLAALCFLLPFIGVSCNTSAASAAIGSLGSIGGSANSSGATVSAACLNALNGHDFYNYSGLNLVTGSEPTAQVNVPGCPATSSSTPSSPLAVSPSAQAPPLGIGVQPLLVVALVLIVVGILGGARRGSAGRVAAGGAALLAAILVVVSNSTAHAAIVNKLDSSGAANGSLQSAGLGGAVDTFFNIHAALGFILVLIALGFTVLANAVALLAERRGVRGAAWSLGGVPPPGGFPPRPPGFPPAPPPTG